MQNETDNRRSAEWHCECRMVTDGTPCHWRGPVADTVVVEYMPKHLRASHQAAGGCGVYPANGAVRLRVSQDCADMLAEEYVDGEPTGESDPWVIRIEG